jgi:pimeloyl-ACP methyl ester carboxylesterase
MREPRPIVLIPGMALALLDTGARADAPEQTERCRTQIALTQRGRFADIADLQYPLLVHPARLRDEALRGVVRLMADETGSDAFVREQTAIIERPDSRPDLATIDCPTLDIVGDADAVTPPELAAEMASAIPGARLVTVPDCGHLAPLERPEPVTQALVAWLET